jgi:Protein of unknown function (DUF3343)
MDTLLIAFDSTQQALRAEMLLEYADIEIDICPTPKEITAGCALSIAFPSLELDQVKRIILSENVEIRGLFEKTPDGYSEIA